jgi:DUF1680 family protein
MSRVVSLFVTAVMLTASGVYAEGAEEASARPVQSHDYAVQLVPFADVQLSDHFWAPRLETNRKVTIPHLLRELEKQGSLGGFALLAGQKGVHYHGYMFGDSDVYKTLEGIDDCLQTHPDAALKQQTEDIVTTMIKAQASDGYLMPHLQITDPKYKHFSKDASETCELYSMGHMIESAVAHFQTSRDHRFVEAAKKLADLISQAYGPGRREMPSGHPEIELALVRLYRATQNPAYLNLAAFLVEQSKHIASRWTMKPAMGDGEAWGHVVAVTYLWCGATDVAVLKDDPSLMKTVEKKWKSVVGRKMYLTGGVGYRPSDEGFPPDYVLPNSGNIYAETCAAIANIFWNTRLFQAQADGRYMDVLERSLYNGFLVGVSLSGDRFFYVNTLESDGKWGFNHGTPERFAWLSCPCCPTNIVRFLPTLPSLVYATTADSLYVNLFVDGLAKLNIGKTAVTLRQETRYPWDGRVQLTLKSVAPSTFTIHIRIPGWAQGQPIPSDLYRFNNAEKNAATLAVNGEPVPVKTVKGYVAIQREWHEGDTITLNLPMPVRRVVANPAVKDDVGRFAVERGPLVYCAEGADNNGKVLDKMPGPSVSFETIAKPDLLGGIVAIKMTPKDKGTPLTLIPYYAWCNRGPNEMAVWFRSRPADKKANP